MAGLGAETGAPVAPAKTNVPAAKVAAAPPDRGFKFIHDEVVRIPWSVHVVKAARGRPGLEVDTALGRGPMLGVANVSQQMQLIPPTAGRPVAAINGDMFQSGYLYPGDPDGLQIVRGELVSAPYPTRVCFWMDAQGNFHRTNVISRFHVTWPNGVKTPFGLNEEREADMAVLYTQAVGPTTRTRGGREFILAGLSNSPCVPLPVGRTFPAVVKAVSETGNSAVPRHALVLSVGSRLAAQLPKLTNGSVLQISTETTPNLAGARTAIGGGPSLVCDKKLWHWPGFMHMRHPRSAIGWNKDYFFMVEVDGRQVGSVGMTFAELAQYMINLGCDEAINLDGGGSATLWVEGRVVNNPCQGFERPAANSVVLIERPAK
jgi:hypothetical protein